MFLILGIDLKKIKITGRIVLLAVILECLVLYMSNMSSAGARNSFEVEESTL